MQKKIVFNDQYHLTQAVIDGVKTQKVTLISESELERYGQIGDPSLMRLAKYKPFKRVRLVQRRGFYQKSLAQYQVLITNVQAKRVQDITDIECLRMGIRIDPTRKKMYYYQAGYIELTFYTPREAFASLFDRCFYKGAWDENRAVFIYSFVLSKD